MSPFLSRKPDVARLIAAGDVEGLERAARHKDWNTRRHAIEGLGACVDERASDALIGILDDPLDGSAETAISALGRRGDPKAVAPLIHRLVAGGMTERRTDEIEDALAALGACALPALVAELASDRPAAARLRALDALERFGRSGWPAIEGVLADRDVQIRRAAAAALERMGWEATPCAAGVHFCMLRGDRQHLERIARADAIPTLIEYLEGPDSAGALEAAAALRTAGDRRAITALVGVLDSPDANLRGLAAQALESLGWEPRDGRSAARYWVARRAWDRVAALGDAAVPALEAALRADIDAPREMVRVGLPVVETLFALGTPATRDALVIACRSHPDGRVREAAASALGDVDDGFAVDEICRLLNDRDLRSGADPVVLIRELGRLGGSRAVSQLVRFVPGPVSDWGSAQHWWGVEESIAAIRALGRIGDLQAANALIGALDRPGVSEAAIAALCQLRAVDALRSALGHPHGNIRSGARRALDALEHPPGSA